jgi:hypothetical protein
VVRRASISAISAISASACALSDWARSMSAQIHAARSVWRGIVFTVAFISSAGGVLMFARARIEAAKIEPVATSFALHDSFVAFKQAFARAHAKERVMLIGDSTLLTAEGMKAPNKQTLPSRIAVALRKYGEAGARIELSTLRVPGLGPAALYLVSEGIVDTHPDRIVMSLNLRSFSTDWLRSFSYAESAGWLPPSQLLDALSLPLFYGGLTADRLLFYRALVSCGAEQTWPDVRRLQGRAFKFRDWLATRADAAFATKATEDMQFELGVARWVRLTTDVDKLPRMSRSAAERSLAPLLRGVSAEHPTLRILAAIVARFTRARIPILVYAAPVNVEHMRSLGLPMENVERSLRTVARVVRKQRGQFVDFHAVLPERAFRDPGDHFTFEGEPNGTFRLASEIAAAIVKTESLEPDQYVVQ